MNNISSISFFSFHLFILTGKSITLILASNTIYYIFLENYTQDFIEGKTFFESHDAVHLHFLAYSLINSKKNKSRIMTRISNFASFQLPITKFEVKHCFDMNITWLDSLIKLLEHSILIVYYSFSYVKNKYVRFQYSAMIKEHNRI